LQPKINMMKKKLLFLFTCANFYAQPVLTASDINPLSVSSTNYNAEISTIPVSAGGPNQIWDYSSLVLDETGTSSAQSVSTAPFSSNYPTANFFVQTGDGVDLEYGIYNLTPTKLEALGATDSTGPSLTFSNPSTIFVFPFTYNLSFTDSFTIIGTSDPETITKTYDAYGTLSTVFGTYSNVIRLKQVQGQFTNYNWIALNPYRELMSAASNLTGDVFYSVNEPTNLGMETNYEKSNFTVYPNPSNGIITIGNTSNIPKYFVTIYDVFGSQISSTKQLSGNSNDIDLTKMASGIYFVKMTTLDNDLLYSTKIIKN
jgi:Secretion system C-terminal sorting domain